MKIIERNVGWDKNHYLIEIDKRNVLSPKYLVDHELKISALIDKARSLFNKGVNELRIDDENLLSDISITLGCNPLNNYCFEMTDKNIVLIRNKDNKAQP